MGINNKIIDWFGNMQLIICSWDNQLLLLLTRLIQDAKTSDFYIDLFPHFEMAIQISQLRVKHLSQVFNNELLESFHKAVTISENDLISLGLDKDNELLENFHKAATTFEDELLSHELDKDEKASLTRSVLVRSTYLTMFSNPTRIHSGTSITQPSRRLRMN